jgi:hypothetical protein
LNLQDELRGEGEGEGEGEGVYQKGRGGEMFERMASESHDFLMHD